MSVTRGLEALFPGFDRLSLPTADGIRIHLTIGGAGSALLPLHGHPQTRAIWHKVALALAERFTVVAANLRGYGDSSKPEVSKAAQPPPAPDDHPAYSKRASPGSSATSGRASRGFETWRCGRGRGTERPHLGEEKEKTTCKDPG